MAYEITGKLQVIKDTEQVNDRFKKREFVIETQNDQYPQVLLFEAAQDKVSLIDNFQVGQTVTVHFDIRGRKWTSPKNEDRYFITLSPWRIEPAGGNAGSGPAPVPPPSMADLPPESDEDDVLPF